MICGKCQNENRDGAQFCKVCGARLITVAQPQPSEGNVCPSCGSMNSVTSKFCKVCGRRMDGASTGDRTIVTEAGTGSVITDYTGGATGSSKGGENQGLKKALLICTIILCVALIAFVLGTMVNGNGGSQTPAQDSSDTVWDEDEYYDQEDEGGTETMEEVYNEYADYSEDFIFPESSCRYLEESEIDGLSKKDVQWAINEIYARKGRIFGEDPYKSYFEECEWYTPTVSGSEFSDEVFNTYEQHNVDLLADYMKKHFKKK